MIAVLSIALGGAVILGVVLAFRWLDSRSWRRSLVALSVQFPRALKADQVSAWLGLLGTLRVPVVLEIIATRESIRHYLLVPKARRADVLAGTRATLPGLRLDDAPDYPTTRVTRWQAVTELRITHLSHQLSTDRAEATAAAFLGTLGQLGPKEMITVQWLMVGVRTPRARRADDPAKELARAEKVKHAQPLLQAVGRVGVQAATAGRAYGLLNRVIWKLRLLDAPGVAIIRRSVPAMLVRKRINERSWPLTAWPVIVNTKEAAGLVGVPMGDALNLPGLDVGRSRQRHEAGRARHQRE